MRLVAVGDVITRRNRLRSGPVLSTQSPPTESLMETLREMFEETLKDVYFAENAIIKALPKMAKSASSEELKEAFDEHLQETKGQVDRLNKIFKILGSKAEGKECPALKGLVEETEEVMSDAKKPEVL